VRSELAIRSFVATQAQGEFETVPTHANDIARDRFVDDQRFGDSGHMSQKMSGVQHGKLATATHVYLALDGLEFLVPMRPSITVA